MKKYKCKKCHKETTLCLVIRDGEEDIEYYCPNYECIKQAELRIGSVHDRKNLQKFYEKK